MFGKKKISEKEWKYVDNMELFESDMRIVVDFLAEGNGYRSDRKVVHKAALIKMIKVLSGDTDVDDIEDWLEEQGIREEDEVKVCELFDQYERKGRSEGEARRLVKDVESAMRFFRLHWKKPAKIWEQRFMDTSRPGKFA